MTQSQSATGDQMGAPPPIQATHKPRLSNWTRFRFLRSTGFRFAILHTLIFVISVAIIGAITEVAVTSSLERQARQRVDTEAAALVNGFERDGSAARGPWSRPAWRPGKITCAMPFWTAKAEP